MALQVQTAYNSFSRYKRDITDVTTATFCEWADWINKLVYRHLLKIDPERFISTQTYTISSSPSTQALPASFRDMQAFGCGLFLYDSEDRDSQLAETGFGSGVRGFYLNGSNIVFTGIENETFKMRYVPKITTIDGLTDYFTTTTALGGVEIIPDEYTEFTTKALDVLYSQWDEDIPMEGISDARFSRLLDEFSRSIKRTPSVYSIKDSSNIL